MRTSIPSMNVANINVHLEVDQLKLVVIEHFQWSITVYNDTNFKLKNAFERWIKMV